MQLLLYVSLEILSVKSPSSRAHSEAHESNTRYSQGGIIGRGPDDNSQLLFEDIVAAGAGVTSPEAARILADEGPPLLNEVLERTAGVVFDHTQEGTPVWGQEAAHSRRRILHVGDSTGLAIMNGLVSALKKFPNIKIETEATAVDLITFPHHSRNPLDNYREIVMAATSSIARRRLFIVILQARRFSLPVDWGAFIETRQTPSVRVVMA